MPDAAAILTRLVAVEGITGQESAILSEVHAVCAELGLESDITPDGVVVHVTGNTLGKRLLFCSHLDTVPAGEGWRMPPHAKTIHDGFVYGRGAVDARGCCVAMLMAARECQKQGLETGELIVVLSIGEEGDDPSLPRLLETLEPKTIDGAVVGEPTNLQIAISQPGLAVLELIATGDQEHASRSTGINAIEALAKDVLLLPDIKSESDGNAWLRLTPTRLDSGVADNVTPPEARGIIDVRMQGMTSAEIVRILQGRLSSAIRVQSDLWVPCETPVNAAVLKAAKRTFPDSDCYASDAASDWAFLERAGIAAIKLGPGDPAMSHRPDECMSIAELEAGCEGYARLASNFFQEGRG